MPNPEILRKIILPINACLHRSTECYYVLDYLRYGEPDNPDFILTLKNTFNEKSIRELNQARQQVKDILVRWIPKVMQDTGLISCTMVCTPRAKALDTYTNRQLYLLAGVSEAAQALSNVEDGTGAIVRTVNTKTTHLRKPTDRMTASGDREPNDGAEPYAGITMATCQFDQSLIRGKSIILIDDIYTEGINIDEDCVQALYDNGATKVVLFTLSCTV